MGGGSYSTSRRFSTATTKGYFSKSANEIFTQNLEHKIHNDMDPNNVKIRESCDSKEHPDVISIILALDVTGSMGHIPHNLVKDGLPTIMGTIIENAGIKDPQLLFLAIGDHECDRAPLQVGQFESSDELLDNWLTKVWIEGCGGGNGGESYLLAWYFASYHTSIDSFNKRNQKGFLFTIGDEPTLPEISGKELDSIMGQDKNRLQNYTAADLLAKARERFNVFHLHITETGNGRSKSTQSGWKELMGENVIFVDNYKDIPKIVAETIINQIKNSSNLKQETVWHSPVTSDSKTESDKTESITETDVLY